MIILAIFGLAVAPASLAQDKKSSAQMNVTVVEKQRPVRPSQISRTEKNEVETRSQQATRERQNLNAQEQPARLDRETALRDKENFRKQELESKRAARQQERQAKEIKENADKQPKLDQKRRIAAEKYLAAEANLSRAQRRYEEALKAMNELPGKQNIERQRLTQEAALVQNDPEKSARTQAELAGLEEKFNKQSLKAQRDLNKAIRDLDKARERFERAQSRYLNNR